jgi:hypothetical protein
MAIAAAHYWAVGSEASLTTIKIMEVRTVDSLPTFLPKHQCVAKRQENFRDIGARFPAGAPPLQVCALPKESFGIGLFVLIDLQAREIPLVIHA